MKVLVLGKGFLGREFEEMGYEVWGRDKLDFDKHTKLDILKPYDAIINCIGISNTRYCEDPENFERVMNVNGNVPRILSQLSEYYRNEKKIKIVHISTGCLYDEIGRPCTEEDFLSAHCGYTVSKYVGEMGCNKEHDIILRPRLLFSDKIMTTRNNLIQKLLKFDTFVDELNSVTWNRTIVEATQALLDADASGVFNVANEGRHTIYEIATQMLGKGGTKMSGEELIKSQGLHLVNNVMDISKLKQYYTPAPVEEAIKYCYNKIVSSSVTNKNKI